MKSLVESLKIINEKQEFSENDIRYYLNIGYPAVMNVVENIKFNIKTGVLEPIYNTFSINSYNEYKKYMNNFEKMFESNLKREVHFIGEYGPGETEEIKKYKPEVYKLLTKNANVPFDTTDGKTLLCYEFGLNDENIKNDLSSMSIYSYILCTLYINLGN